jgi:D-glycerate 3-kinase
MRTPTYMPRDAGFPVELVEQALDDALAVRATVPVLAISGLQGSGKSTLAAQVVDVARARGLRAATVSIDDFYLTRAQRQRLARQVHPLLLTRGPPGTHDLPLAQATLDAITSRQPVALPRFDKLADERLPTTQWPWVGEPLDLLVFEGWFLGTPAQATEDLSAPLNALERDADSDGRWRHWCNQALADDYRPLATLRPAVVPAAAGFFGGSALALAAGTAPAGRPARPQQHEPCPARALRAVLRTGQPTGAARAAGAGRPRRAARRSAPDRRVRDHPRKC